MRAMRSDANERRSSTPSNNAAADPRLFLARLLCHRLALVKAVLSIHQLVLFCLIFNAQIAAKQAIAPIAIDRKHVRMEGRTFF